MILEVTVGEYFLQKKERRHGIEDLQFINPVSDLLDFKLPLWDVDLENASDEMMN